MRYFISPLTNTGFRITESGYVEVLNNIGDWQESFLFHEPAKLLARNYPEYSEDEFWEKMRR